MPWPNKDIRFIVIIIIHCLPWGTSSEVPFSMPLFHLPAGALWGESHDGACHFGGSPFGSWRCHLARWEACHLILSCLRLLANQVPLPSPAVRWGGKRKAPLNFSFPLEGKCHVVAKGCTRLNILMKLTIVLLGLTSPHLEVLCRTPTGDYGGES